MGNAAFGLPSASYPQFCPQILWKTPVKTNAMAGQIIRVGLATPLLRLFDYRCPALTPGEEQHPPAPGKRVVVPFGKRTRIGVIVAVADTSLIPATRLRNAIRIIDAGPLFDASLMALLDWAAGYYHHPPG